MQGFIILLLAASLIFGVSDAAASDEAEIKKMEGYQEEMRGMPDRVSPDSLYMGYSLEKIYYQNRQMIRILKDMRDNMPDPSQGAQIIALLEDIHALLEKLSSRVGADERPRTDTEFLVPKE